MKSIHPHNINIIPGWLFMSFIDIMLLAHRNARFDGIAVRKRGRGGSKWIWNSVNNVKISLMLLFSHLCGLEFLSQRGHALNPDCIYFHFFNIKGPWERDPREPQCEEAWVALASLSSASLCSVHLLLTLLFLPAEVANLSVLLNGEIK